MASVWSWWRWPPGHESGAQNTHSWSQQITHIYWKTTSPGAHCSPQRVLVLLWCHLETKAVVMVFTLKMCYRCNPRCYKHIYINSDNINNNFTRYLPIIFQHTTTHTDTTILQKTSSWLLGFFTYVPTQQTRQRCRKLQAGLPSPWLQISYLKQTTTVRIN